MHASGTIPLNTRVALLYIASDTDVHLTILATACVQGTEARDFKSSAFQAGPTRQRLRARHRLYGNGVIPRA
jgi:hypothetical protein